MAGKLGSDYLDAIEVIGDCVASFANYNASRERAVSFPYADDPELAVSMALRDLSMNPYRADLFVHRY